MTNADRYAHLRDTTIPCLNQAHGADWSFYHGDSCQVLQALPDGCIDYVMTSIPFIGLFTFSASNYDIGNVRSDEEFMDHMKWLADALYRVIRPGRLISIHCMDIPTTLSCHGYIGMKDFRGMTVEMLRRAGFVFASTVTIRKDPVTAMMRSKSIGLLYKTLRGDRKEYAPDERAGDSCLSRQGAADHLVQFYKPLPGDKPIDLMYQICKLLGTEHIVTFRHTGDNEEPIEHSSLDYPLDLWQQVAEPVWMDIKETDVLYYRNAKEEEEEKHICPLQLSVIERGIQLWSNPGDVVLDPFGGIGSTGYKAIQMGRRAVLCELKSSYWEIGVKNLESASPEGQKQLKLAGME